MFSKLDQIKHRNHLFYFALRVKIELELKHLRGGKTVITTTKLRLAQYFPKYLARVKQEYPQVAAHSNK